MGIKAVGVALACLMSTVSVQVLAQDAVLMRRPLPTLKGGTDIPSQTPTPSPTPTPAPTPTPTPETPSDGFYEVAIADGYCDAGAETYYVGCQIIEANVENGQTSISGSYGAQLSSCTAQQTSPAYQAVASLLSGQGWSVVAPDQVASKNGSHCVYTPPVVSTAYAGICGDDAQTNLCRSYTVTDNNGSRTIQPGPQVDVSQCNTTHSMDQDVYNRIWSDGYFPISTRTVDSWCKGEGDKDGDAVAGECQDDRTIKMRCVIAFTTGGFREIPCAMYSPVRGQTPNIYTHIEDLEDALGNCEGEKAGRSIDFFKNVTTKDTPSLNYRYSRNLRSEYFSEIKTIPQSGYYYTDEPGGYNACMEGSGGTDCVDYPSNVMFIRHRVELEYVCTDVDDYWGGGDGTAFWQGSHSFPMSRGQCQEQMLADIAALQNDGSSAEPPVMIMRQMEQQQGPQPGMSFIRISPTPYVDEWSPPGNQKMPTYSFTVDEANKKIIIEELGWMTMYLPNT